MCYFNFHRINDTVGPSGYGDANFIPANLVLEYKIIIRFKNDANATAPAQRVFIRHQLDDGGDERFFRVGSFGFGDFTQNVTVQRAFLQVGDTGTYNHCDLCVLQSFTLWVDHLYIRLALAGTVICMGKQSSEYQTCTILSSLMTMESV